MGRKKRVTLQFVIDLFRQLSITDQNEFILQAFPPTDPDFFTRPFVLSEEEKVEQQKILAPIIKEANDSLQLLINDSIDNYKSKRNRKSSPEIVRRNVEICDLRKDRKRWSLGRLAKKFEVTTRNITLIIKAEDKWRSLASELGSE